MSRRMMANGERTFRKQKRSNKTHASIPDPDAHLDSKGNGQSRLFYLGHALGSACYIYEPPSPFDVAPAMGRNPQALHRELCGPISRSFPSSPNP